MCGYVRRLRVLNGADDWKGVLELIVYDDAC